MSPSLEISGVQRDSQEQEQFIAAPTLDPSRVSFLLELEQLGS